MDNFSSGGNAMALRFFEDAYQCRQDANTLKLVFASACKSKNRAKAKLYWKKMSEPMQNSVTQFCVGNGITTTDLNEP